MHIQWKERDQWKERLADELNCLTVKATKFLKRYS